MLRLAPVRHAQLASLLGNNRIGSSFVLRYRVILRFVRFDPELVNMRVAQDEVKSAETAPTAKNAA